MSALNFFSCRKVAALGACLLVGTAGCASTEAELPDPRPLVVHSGARITVERSAEMRALDDWVRRTMTVIQEDPSFLIETRRTEATTLPWEGLEIEGDTARVRVEDGATDATAPYMIYGFLHLMHEMGRLEEFLPDSVVREGAAESGLERADLTPDYSRERAILGRLADTWLLGRAFYDFAPYRPLDELLYAREAGFLDAYLLTARAEEFDDVREDWLEERPGRLDAYLEWYDEAFGGEPPGR